MSKEIVTSHRTSSLALYGWPIGSPGVLRQIDNQLRAYRSNEPYLSTRYLSLQESRRQFLRTELYELTHRLFELRIVVRFATFKSVQSANLKHLDLASGVSETVSPFGSPSRHLELESEPLLA